MAAAGCSGFVTDVVTNPLWVVRTRLATQMLQSKQECEPETYRGMRHAFRRICTEEGPGALFAGLSASLLGLSHIMIQFPLYERLKQELARPSVNSPSVAGDLATSDTASLAALQPARSSSSATSPMADIVIASGLSKLVASTVTYPHEVVRARLQFDRGGKLYSGLLDATKKTCAACAAVCPHVRLDTLLLQASMLAACEHTTAARRYRSEGLLGFWLGFRLNIVRTIPQSIVTFTMYELLSKVLHRHLQTQEQRPHQEQAAAHLQVARIERVARTRSENRG